MREPRGALAPQRPARERSVCVACGHRDEWLAVARGEHYSTAVTLRDAARDAPRADGGQATRIMLCVVAQALGVATAPAAAASSTAATFSWTKNWYPAAFSKITDRELPSRVELFGQPIALWYDHTKDRWNAVKDACPHRLAPLSEGRVDEAGQIECPYHGWTFDGCGACTKIPQMLNGGEASALAKCGGTSYAVAEVQGLLWIWGEAGATAVDESTIPRCEALDDAVPRRGAQRSHPDESCAWRPWGACPVVNCLRSRALTPKCVA